MLNNINTDIDALKLEDINIGLGGVALGESISSLSTALGDEVARALCIESGLRTDLNSELGRAKGIEAGIRADVDAITPLVGINNVFSMFKTTADRPLDTSFQMWSSYDTIIKSSPHISYVAPNVNTYVAPNVNTGGVNTGFIIQTSGYYKLEYIINAKNETYTERVCWFSKIMVDGLEIQQRTFIYTRSNDNMYIQFGSATVFVIHYCNQNDYIQLLTLVAKNSNYFNDNYTGLIGDTGSNFIITYLCN